MKTIKNQSIQSLKKTCLPGRLMAAVCLMGVSAYGGTLVPDLNDSSAFLDSSIAYSNATPVSSFTLSSGLTLAASFTPDAADVANSANGAVAVLEIGGTSNGTGLWIINGNLWYLAKGLTAPAAAPSSILDLNGSDKAIGVQLGAVTAGVQWDVFASLNTSSGTLLISQNSNVLNYSLTGVTSSWNWAGAATAAMDFGLYDPTVTAAGPPAKLGRNGGLADATSGGDSFGDTQLYNFDGSLGRGQMFNAVSTVPEPSTLALGALGGAAVIFLRRRKR